MEKPVSTPAFKIPTLPFDEWLSRVASELEVDAVNAAEFALHYAHGLTPAEAVLADREAEAAAAVTTGCEMRVSLDGGSTYFDAPQGVRVLHLGVLIPGEDGRGELHLNHTSEGLIADVWATREESLDHNIGTRCFELAALVEDMVESAA